MKHIKVNNVCEALPLGLELLIYGGEIQDSRAGPVYVYPTPVVTEYAAPWQRVLFSPIRDANPFFHLAEAMWMLAGRNDAEYINRFVHDFGLRFAEDGKLNASYGHRWRLHFEDDQLDYIVDRLKKDPNDRRIVLSMWDGMYDLFSEDAKSHDGRKDIPCNTHAYFRIVNHSLQMTVCCRSNDIIWGAYGANAVHFSFLQEYLASRLGVGIGTYYQISNNYHAYVSEIDRLNKKDNRPFTFSLNDNRYHDYGVRGYPLWTDDRFDEELSAALECESRKYHNSFLSEVLIPALKAHKAFKNNTPTEKHLSEIKSFDWRIACTEWITRRIASRLTQEEVVG